MMLRKLALFILPALFLVACGSSAPLVPSWTQLGEDIDGEGAYDYSGHSVSLSSDGTTVAIGAYKNDGNGTDAGHVRIYKFTDNIWIQRGDDIDGEAASDWSGRSVSLSSDGSTVAIGATSNDGNGTNAGHVRIYKWTNSISSWVKVGEDIDGEAAYDESGFSVSLSSDGSTVAIGARSNDGNGTNAGHVRIYRLTDDTSPSWVKVGEDINGEAANDNSGYSVSLSSDGSTVAIGATSNNGNGNFAGHVRIYEWTNNIWIQRGNDIDGEAAGDWSGHSVSLSSDGSTVAIGALYNGGSGTNAGHVRIYELTNNIWIQRGDDIDGEAAYDWSGRSVSLSSDGSTVAIGASYNDGNGTDDAGHVCIYKWTNGTSWVKVGEDIDGEAAGDESGHSVSLSSDGTTVAIGAMFNDGNGTDAGHVRVFKINLPTGAAFGDPHFKLMNGNYMSYHGQCDILLSRIESFASGLGLEVHIRTTRVDRSVKNMAYSYISGAAVRIGSDVLEVLESGMLLINGNAATAQLLVNEEEGRGNAAMVADHRSLLISGYKIKSSAKGSHRRIFIHNLDLGNSNHVQIRANTLTGMLTVDLVGEAFGNSEGLISGKNVADTAEDADNWENTLLGVVGEDGLMADRSTGYWNSYAESWQIKGDDNKLFHDTNRHPQYPVGCVYHTNKNLRGRRLIDSGESVVSLEMARNMCAGKVAKKREYCIFDIMATGDLEIVNDPSYN